MHEAGVLLRSHPRAHIAPWSDGASVNLQTKMNMNIGLNVTKVLLKEYLFPYPEGAVPADAAPTHANKQRNVVGQLWAQKLKQQQEPQHNGECLISMSVCDQG